MFGKTFNLIAWGISFFGHCFAPLSLANYNPLRLAIFFRDGQP